MQLSHKADANHFLQPAESKETTPQCFVKKHTSPARDLAEVLRIDAPYLFRRHLFTTPDWGLPLRGDHLGQLPALNIAHTP
jgi:hypothetical protein